MKYYDLHLLQTSVGYGSGSQTGTREYIMNYRLESDAPYTKVYNKK